MRRLLRAARGVFNHPYIHLVLAHGHKFLPALGKGHDGIDAFDRAAVFPLLRKGLRLAGGAVDPEHLLRLRGIGKEDVQDHPSLRRAEELAGFDGAPQCLVLSQQLLAGAQILHGHGVFKRRIDIQPGAFHQKTRRRCVGGIGEFFLRHRLPCFAINAQKNGRFGGV